MSKYKTFKELKEELGNKFEEYMYKSNIELLEKIDKALEYINNNLQQSLKEMEYCNDSDILDSFVAKIERILLEGKND